VRTTDWKEARKITMDQMLAEENSMVKVPNEFWQKVIERHRTITRPDMMAYTEQFLKQCPACDGHTWKIWRDGDPVYECAIWQEAREHNLLPVGSD
jgi:hypothetical protein